MNETYLNRLLTVYNHHTDILNGLAELAFQRWKDVTGWTSHPKVQVSCFEWIWADKPGINADITWRWEEYCYGDTDENEVTIPFRLGWDDEYIEVFKAQLTAERQRAAERAEQDEARRKEESQRTRRAQYEALKKEFEPEE